MKITVNNKQVPTTDQLFWAGYSGVVYLPSTVGPAGLTTAGLPVGYQAIAASGADKRRSLSAVSWRGRSAVSCRHRASSDRQRPLRAPSATKCWPTSTWMWLMSA